MTAYVKCQVSGCTEIATWRTGTWWMCAKHVEDYRVRVPEDLQPMFGEWFSPYGWTYESGPCKAEDYWIGEIPADSTVEVAEDGNTHLD